MPVRAKYVHTNLMANDWRKLVQFYTKVFGCEMAGAERDLSGLWLDRATGIPNAHIRGVHLRLPGYGAEGPTLEIFQYNEMEKRSEKAAANRPGFGHIAFAVDDVEAAVKAVIVEGGHPLGEMVTVDIPDAGRIVFAYLKDPEGNIIELQHWF